MTSLREVVVPKHVAEWYRENLETLETSIKKTLTSAHGAEVENTFEYWLLHTPDSIGTLYRMQQLGFKEVDDLYVLKHRENYLYQCCFIVTGKGMRTIFQETMFKSGAQVFEGRKAVDEIVQVAKLLGETLTFEKYGEDD